MGAILDRWFKNERKKMQCNPSVEQNVLQNRKYLCKGAWSHTNTPDCCRLRCKCCNSCSRSWFFFRWGCHLVHCAFMYSPPTAVSLIPSDTQFLVRPSPSLESVTTKRRYVFIQLQCEVFSGILLSMQQKDRLRQPSRTGWHSAKACSHCKLAIATM